MFISQQGTVSVYVGFFFFLENARRRRLPADSFVTSALSSCVHQTQIAATSFLVLPSCDRLLHFISRASLSSKYSTSTAQVIVRYNILPTPIIHVVYTISQLVGIPNENTSINLKT